MVEGKLLSSQASMLFQHPSDGPADRAKASQEAAGTRRARPVLGDL